MPRRFEAVCRAGGRIVVRSRPRHEGSLLAAERDTRGAGLRQCSPSMVAASPASQARRAATASAEGHPEPAGVSVGPRRNDASQSGVPTCRHGPN